MRKKSALYLLFAVLAATAAYGMSQISRSVLGAGGLGGSGATVALSSTVGQSVVGSVSGATHTLRSGFWTSQVIPASVGAETPPLAFQLADPVPNPFTRELAIHYDVPATGGVLNLRVYDIGGRLVRTLIHNPDSPGHRRILWDGRDDGGNRLPLGVYFLSLDAPGYTATRKIVLVN